MRQTIEAKTKICYHCGKYKNYREIIERDEYSVCVECIVLAAALPLYGHALKYWDKLVSGREEEAKLIMKKLKKELTIIEYNRLYKWAVVFHCIDLMPISKCILRVILSRNKIAKDAVKEIIRKQSVDDILPMGF